MSIDKIKIVNEAVNLLKKDFAAFGLEIKFSGNVDTAYMELKNQLAIQLEKLIRSNYSQLQSILYRIDVSERMINAALKNISNNQYAAIIADLILERELQKALTRVYFRDKDIAKRKLDINDFKKLEE